MVRCWFHDGGRLLDGPHDLPAVPQVGDKVFMEGQGHVYKVESLQWQFGRQEGRTVLLMVNVILNMA